MNNLIRRNIMNKTMMLALALLLSATLCGCGSSDGLQHATQSPASDAYVIPVGKSVITFSAYSSATLPVAISAIALSVTLPAGMSVVTTGVAGQIDTAAVTAGNALTGANLAFGSYSASTRKVRLSMTTPSSNYRYGEFLQLVCDVAAGPAITLGDLRALNNPVSVIKAVGYNQSSQSTVVLTDKLNVIISAAQ